MKIRWFAVLGELKYKAWMTLSIAVKKESTVGGSRGLLSLGFGVAPWQTCARMESAALYSTLGLEGRM